MDDIYDMNDIYDLITIIAIEINSKILYKQIN